MRHAVLVAVVAACVAGLAAPSLAAAPNPDEQAVVYSGLLRRADFPSGWSTTSRGTSPNYAALGAPCRPLVAALSRRVDKASSPGFIQDSSQRAGDTVVLYLTPAGAMALAAALQSPSTTACYRRAATVSVAQTAARAKVALSVQSVAPVAVPAEGDQSLGYEAVVSVGRGAQSETIYEDEVFVRVGRVGISFDFVNTGSSAAMAFTPQIQAVVGRVEAAE